MHIFIFTPGIWLGEGKISFSGSQDEIKFFTKWEVEREKEGVIRMRHFVEMQGIDQRTSNSYVLSDVGEGCFRIKLSNDMLERVEGKGVYSPRTISWEFNLPGVFEGRESYERVEPHLYHFNAEYRSDELFKTFISGILWKKG